VTEKRWYVVAYEDRRDDPNALIWTVSRNPDETGWETDTGCGGYGLTKADAEELANAANRARARDEGGMKASEILLVVETALKAYTRNNALTFLGSLAEQGYRIVPIDQDAAAEAEAADERYTQMWMGVVVPPSIEN
jgi:hypothetical protein